MIVDVTFTVSIDTDTIPHVALADSQTSIRIITRRARDLVVKNAYKIKPHLEYRPKKPLTITLADLDKV